MCVCVCVGSIMNNVMCTKSTCTLVCLDYVYQLNASTRIMQELGTRRDRKKLP